MTTGERIKARRLVLGISAEELAARIGKSPATIYRYEKGDIEKVPSPILVLIAQALYTTPEYLMGWAEAPALPDELSEAKRELIEIIKQMPDERVKAVLAILKG